MADMSVIAGAISSLKLANDIVRGMTNIRDGSLLQAKLIELQTVILSAKSGALSAQSSQFDLLKCIRELEDKVSEAAKWDAEAERYQLRDFGGNTFAYSLKEAQAVADPIHRLCPNCFTERMKSILQMRYRTSAQQDEYFCANCTTVFHFGPYVPPNYSGRSNTYRPMV